MAENRYHCTSSQALELSENSFRDTALPALITTTSSTSQETPRPTIRLSRSMPRLSARIAPIACSHRPSRFRTVPRIASPRNRLAGSDGVPCPGPGDAYIGSSLANRWRTVMPESENQWAAGSTTGAGAPAQSDRNSLSLGSNGPILLHDVHFLEQMAHFNREKVPERQPHAKGAGAFGVLD